MSINDAQEIRERFKKYNMEAVKTLYTLGSPKRVGELLITNY